jgi:DnaJ family protein B protein 12
LAALVSTPWLVEKNESQRLTRHWTGGGGNGFVFNMGGGPGVRVHQMGGGAPRRRPHNHANQPPASPLAALQSLLPLLLLFIIPLLSSLFSGGGTTYPKVHFDNPLPPQTKHHTSYNLKVDYYVNPKDVADYQKGDWKSLDKHVEVSYKERLVAQCNYEIDQKRRARDDARGFFSRDEVKWQIAQNMPTPACNKLEGWGYRIQY